MKKYTLIMILFCLLSCSDDKGNDIDGEGVITLIPNEHEFGAQGGSIEIKADGCESALWGIQSISSSTGGKTTVYEPGRDFEQLDRRLLDVNIDWFSMEVKEPGGTLIINTKENNGSMGRKLEVYLGMYNSGLTIVVTQKGNK